MNTVINAAHAIVAGDGDLFIAGGVESMTRAPFVMAKPSAAFPRGEQTLQDTTLGWRFTNPRLADAYYPYSMGETAENVVERCGVTREEQDAFALRVAASLEGGPGRRPLRGRGGAHRGAGREARRDGDRQRSTSTPARRRPWSSSAKLKPAFRRDASGSVTAGNSSGINDGASALLVTIRGSAPASLAGGPWRACVASAVAGVDPATMGLGPIPASRKALERAGLTADDLDLVELNEAFAAQSIPCIRELGLDPETVNVNGGAIAIGHPLGASGARLVTTLLHEMRRRGARYGLATMCIGVGQGIASRLGGRRLGVGSPSAAHPSRG